MRLDLHVHTCYSYDSTLTLDQLAAAVIRRRLDGVAILDHDEIDGALELQRRAACRVIVGEEIGSAHGGIGALFIHERIPPHLTAEETIARIRAQNGLVLIPHPLSRAVPGRIDARKLREIIDKVDVIEGYNARAWPGIDDRRACYLAGQHGLPVSAGSDAHFSFEVGRAWTEMDSFETPQDFLRSLHRARLHSSAKTALLVPLFTVAVMIPALFLRRALSLLAGKMRPGS